MVKLVTYDLHKPTKDYERLFEALRSYPSWAHPLDSVWFLDTNQDTSAVRNHLQNYIDADDSLIVTGISGWATSNVSKKATDWLKQR